MCKKIIDLHQPERVPIVIAVLLNWNRSEYTISCVESLLKSKVPPDSIIVVDNGSIDGSPELIEKRYPSIELIRNNCNLGFAAGSNQGIRRAIDDGADFVWVLNNDTLVDPECLYELLEASRRFPTGACFSGKIYLVNPNNVIWYAGGYRHKLHLAPVHWGEGKTENGKQEETRVVSFLSGCCMLFPRWALDSLGFFIEDYFTYSEDNEWCWRATSAGAQLFYVPRAKLWHHVSASAEEDNKASGSTSITAESWFYRVRNHLWTVRLWAKPPIRKYFALSTSVMVELKMIALHLVRKDYARARSICKGIYHGICKPVPRWSFDR